MTITPTEPYRPRWWQVWLLPLAAPLVIGVLAIAGIVVWWTAFGGRQAANRAGTELGRGIATASYRAMIEAQRIEGVDTSPAAQLPVFLGTRRIGQTTGVIQIGPRPLDTLMGATERWVHAESLISTNLGSRTSIISSVLLSQVKDSAQRQNGLADLLASPAPSVIYAGQLESSVDTTGLASLVAVLELAPGAAGVPVIRLDSAGAASRARRGQLWLGPGPVILPLQ